MRILYLTDNNSVHNRRFLLKITEAGHEVFYLPLCGFDQSDGWLPPGASLVSLSHAIAASAGASALDSLVDEFTSVVSKLRPDVLHAGPVHTCGYLAARSNFHPMLLVSWGSDLLVDAGRTEENQRATRSAVQSCDAFFCDSDTVKRRAMDFGSLNEDRIVQFPWGISPGVFVPEGSAPKLFDETDNPFVILCTRAWESVYAIDVLLQAFRLAHMANPRLRLVLLGGGSKANEVHRFIQNHNLAAQVLLPGTIPEQEIPGYFRAADLYATCTVSDGTSISLLEAMSTGLPVLVADNPSNREWIIPGENGWLGEVNSAESFASYMLEAAALSSDQRARISRMNACIISQRANWDLNFPALLKMYDTLTLTIPRAATSTWI